MRSMLRKEITFHCTGNSNNNNVKMKIMFKYQQAILYICIWNKGTGERKKAEEIRAIML